MLMPRVPTGVRHRPVVFFDIDNTLIDQRSAEAVAAEAFLARFAPQLPHCPDVESFCRLWRGLREKHARAFLHGRVSDREQRRRRMRELFAINEVRLGDREIDERIAIHQGAYSRAWRLFNDAPPCLAALNGVTLGIISNGSAAQQRSKLAHTGIHDRFDVIVISQEAGCAKPRAEIFEAACREVGAHPRRCIHVGDRRDIDALACRRIGMRGVWLNRDGPDGEHATKGNGEGSHVQTIASLAQLPGLLLADAGLRL